VPVLKIENALLHEVFFTAFAVAFHAIWTFDTCTNFWSMLLYYWV